LSVLTIVVRVTNDRNLRRCIAFTADNSFCIAANAQRFFGKVWALMDRSSG
jgi:hypothetical protein